MSKLIDKEKKGQILKVTGISVEPDGEGILVMEAKTKKARNYHEALFQILKIISPEKEISLRGTTELIKNDRALLSIALGEEQITFDYTSLLSDESFCALNKEAEICANWEAYAEELKAHGLERGSGDGKSKNNAIPFYLIDEDAGETAKTFIEQAMIQWLVLSYQGLNYPDFEPDKPSFTTTKHTEDNFVYITAVFPGRKSKTWFKVPVFE